MTRFTRAGWLALTLAVALPLGVYGVHASAAQERMAQPQITSVTPVAKIQEKAPQTLTVNGRNFVEGLTLEITSPEGQMQVLSGQEIRGLRESSFQISLLIYSIIAGILTVIVIDIPLLVAIWALGITGLILASIAANKGKYYRYPMCVRLIR